MTVKHYDKFYIDGAWTSPRLSAPFELVDPATETVFASVALGTAEDIDAAVRAARRAFASFSRTSTQERLDLLDRIIAAYQKREPDIAAMITQEMGAPVSLKGQTGAGLAALRQARVTLSDYEFETRMGDNIVLREPIGVCGLITPWNWPVQLLCNKLASALSAGCTVIVKPSEFTPLSTLLVAEVLDEAGVPAGVFNVVLGDGPTVGAAISAHPDIDMVSFTGSTRAGIEVARTAAATVKRVTQELGGKSANIVMPDADLDAAANFTVTRAFSNSGQSCHAPSRALVPRDKMKAFSESARTVAEGLRVGSPKDPSTTLGPVVNKAQFERIQRYIRLGLEEGATLVCGGPGRPDDQPRGYFVRPTVFTDVTPEMTIAREEIFGPVVCVMAYEDEEDAVRIANDSPYGLGGYVFAATREEARKIGSRIRAGRIFLNGAPSNTVAPMGGYKQSGNGREMGVFGIEEYLEVKAIIGFEG